MSELESPGLFTKALQKSLGPLDAEHLAHVIMLATSEEDLGMEHMEQEFLLFLLIHEIRNTEPDLRSFRNIDGMIDPDDLSSVESALKYTEAWKETEENSREMALAGVKDRLMSVMLADNPELQSAI
jgi:hypothetical protein